jgi:hypothetical protein
MLPLPPELVRIRDTALRAIQPIRPPDANTRAPEHFVFKAERTKAGDNLPAYYLVYFLLVDLLGFRDLGQSEKVSWSVVIDYNGKAFVIEHRKLGIGVFTDKPQENESAAADIVRRIQGAVKVARPFFDWLAEQAVAASTVNVLNNSDGLHDRFQFLLDLYKAKIAEADARKDEKHVTKGKTGSGATWTSVKMPYFQLKREADWLALAVIEAFFSWTEHAFLHLAVLMDKATSAEDVTSLAEKEWPDKYKTAIGCVDDDSREHYEKLLALRRELRNYIAHGAFGKQGEAFTFHSHAGAVPVMLPHRRGTRKFRFEHGVSLDSKAAIQTIGYFIAFLWAGKRAPARIYLESELPLILTLVARGDYRLAMRSEESMREFAHDLAMESDQAANMDW